MHPVLSKLNKQDLLQPLLPPVLSNIAQLPHQPLLVTQPLWDATKLHQQAQCMLTGWYLTQVSHQSNALGNVFQLQTPLLEQPVLPDQLVQLQVVLLVQPLVQPLVHLVKRLAQLPHFHLTMHHNALTEDGLTGFIWELNAAGLHATIQQVVNQVFQQCHPEMIKSRTSPMDSSNNAILTPTHLSPKKR